MATIYTEKSKNSRKTWVLMSVFFILIIGLGYVFSEIYANRNILYFCIVFSLVINFLSYWYSDKIALSLAKAHRATREKYFDFYNLVENLSITAGLPMPQIYVIEDSSPNAFATGRDKKHAVIAVTTGLLALMNKTELEGVVAHEMSHIGNKDILLSTVVVVLVGFVSILSDVMIRSSLIRGREDRDNVGGVIVLVGILLSIFAPLASSLIQLAISRKREYLADTGAVLLTRYPEGLASALEKLRDYGKPMQARSSAIAHLYISNPLGSEKFRKVNSLFSTHPPIEERIKRLRNSLE